MENLTDLARILILIWEFSLAQTAGNREFVKVVPVMWRL